MYILPWSTCILWSNIIYGDLLSCTDCLMKISADIEIYYNFKSTLLCPNHSFQKYLNSFPSRSIFTKLKEILTPSGWSQVYYCKQKIVDQGITFLQYILGKKWRNFSSIWTGISTEDSRSRSSWVRNVRQRSCSKIWIRMETVTYQSR